MRSFLGGIIGAVVAGLALFFAQNWWTENQADTKQRIQFDQRATLSISRDVMARLARTGSEFETPSILLFDVTNVGKADIVDKSFSLPASSVIGYENISVPNENPNNVSVKYENNILNIKYKLLPVGSKHSLWIASTSPYSIDGFSNDNTGVKVENKNGRLKYEPTPFPWAWIGAIGACFVALIVGAALGEASIAQQLAKKGINYKDLISPTPPSQPQP